MKRPDFFIVGAPKCGTTAMYTYLSDHPEIFMPTFKEPHFFSPDLRPDFSVADLERYLHLFDSAREGHLAVGEASVWYLRSSLAASEIRRFNAASRIIVMVREPVSMFLSLHNQLLATLHEDVVDAEQAWRMQPDRASGRSVPRCCEATGMLMYSRICRLGEQLERWLDVFPRDQIHVVVFDDLTGDPGGEYRRVLRFLGLADDARTDFPRVNVARRMRWPTLGAWHRLTDRRLRSDPRLRAVRGLMTPLRVVTRRFRRSNLREGKRSEISSSFRRELTDYFAADVDRLAGLLARDLSHWRRVGATARPQ